jgi:hypothetical protein
MSVVQSIAINALRKKLSDLIRSDRLIRALGVVDAISAKLVEGAAFDAVYVTGGGIYGEDNELRVTFNGRDRIVGLHDIQELEKLFLALPTGERGQ